MIYFIGSKTEKKVKIGYTISKISQRISVIQSNCPFEVECFLLIEGLKDTEKHIHDVFKSSHIRGEWFTLSKEIEDYINDPKDFNITETFQPTPRKDRINPKDTEIEKYYAWGHSTREIAEILGYTFSQVRTFIARRDLVNKYDGKRRRKRYTGKHQRTPKTIIVPDLTEFVKKD